MEKITGFHAIEETIRSISKTAVISLYITGKGKRHESIEALAASKGIKILKKSKKEIDDLSGDIDNRGALLLISSAKQSAASSPSVEKSSPSAVLQKEQLPNYSSLQEFLKTSDKNKTSIILILDSITDPHNYGAILRSADQCGVDLVITPSRRSAGETTVVHKTSAGASRYVHVVTENLSRATDLLKKNGYWIYGTHMAGEACWSCNLKGSVAIVMGSEGSGISRLLAEKCDKLIKIPSSGHVDSFNVSVATGILLYEIVRQNSM